MPALVWLGIAIAAGIGAFLVGLPAWRSYRSREARDLNADRYLAWRGRARPGSVISTREGMTGQERRSLLIGVGLAAAAVVALIAFFVTS